MAPCRVKITLVREAKTRVKGRHVEHVNDARCGKEAAEQCHKRDGGLKQMPQDGNSPFGQQIGAEPEAKEAEKAKGILRDTNMAVITASRRCLSTGSSSSTRARLHNDRSSADVCVSGCWKKKKKKANELAQSGGKDVCTRRQEPRSAL